MATVDSGGAVRRHPRATTILLSILGYGIVIGTFLDAIPGAVYPDLTLAQVNLLSDAIAAINTTATALLAAGWWWIRRDEVRKHRNAMIGAFALILLFLVLYLLKIGGGGTKEITVTGLPYLVYVSMLAIHVVLSIVAVPVVLYAMVLGLTHTPRELREATPHRTVGQVAAASWIVSLTLGVVTYVMLNHVYGWEFVESAGLLALAGTGARARRGD